MPKTKSKTRLAKGLHVAPILIYYHYFHFKKIKIFGLVSCFIVS